jgi:hypothetical protein
VEFFPHVHSLIWSKFLEKLWFKGDSLHILSRFLWRHRTHDLEDSKELVTLCFSLEDGLKREHLREDTACRPDIDSCGIFSDAEDKLRCSIVTWDDVGSVFALWVNLLAATKVTDFYDTLLRKQNILGFEIPMSDFLGMDVSKTVENLIEVLLNVRGNVPW